MNEFTTDEKKVFAELIGWEAISDAFWDDGVLQYYIVHFKPEKYFTEILKGLTNDQMAGIEGIIDDGIGGVWHLNVYLWIESHKPEILKAILSTLESRTDKTGKQI